MKPSQIDKEILPTLKIVGGVLVLFAGYKLLQRFGILESKESKRLKAYLKQANESPTAYRPKNKMLSFNPQYRRVLSGQWTKKYRSKYGNFSPFFQTKGSISPQKMAVQLANAKGLFSDNEDILYNIFRDLQGQYQLALVSTIFSNTYKKSLLDYLQGFTDEKELLKIFDIVEKLPPYKIPK